MFVQMDEFSVSDKVALQLAGLQAQVIWGPYEDEKEFRYSPLCRLEGGVAGLQAQTS